MILFKTFQLFVGRIGSIQAAVKKLLRKKMILYHNRTSLQFQRTFRIFDDRIEIIDEIDPRISFGDIRVGIKASYIFIPSAKYFTCQEWARHEMRPANESRSDRDGKKIITRIFSVNRSHE